MTDWKQHVREQLPPLALGAEREVEIVAELAQHLEAAYEEARTGGATEAEARADAESHFHDWRVLESELVRAERSVPVPAARGWRDWNDRIETRQKGVGKMFGDLWQDIRYGLRTLRKSPGFTTVAVLTLALGIGANTAIFSVVNGVLLRPLPYENPERLVLIRNDAEGETGLASISPPELVDLREQSQLFEGFAALWASTISLTGDPENMEQIRYAWATDNLFSLLGTDPILGRHFTKEEEAPNGPATVILSYELWQRRFGGDPGVIGKVLQMSDRDRPIVGVLPAGFRVLMESGTGVSSNIEAWVPQNFWFNRNLRWLRVIGKLKPGISLEQAQADMDAIANRLQADHEEYANTGVRFHPIPLHGDLVREVQPAILTLLAAVGFVLLIACANVANLLLARARGREKEIAIRAALGAGRRRILRQVLTESLLLGLLGGVAGLVLARWGVGLLLWLKPANLPRLEDIALDGTVLGFALAASLLTGLLFGLMPAWHSSRLELNEALKEGGRSSGQSGGARLRSALVVAQVALSLVLLIGAGLMIQTFLRLQRVDPGFRPDDLLTARVTVSPRKFPTPESRWRFYQQLQERLDTLPGVRSSSAISNLPLAVGFFTGPYAYDAATEESWGTLSADFLTALPNYFSTMGTRLTAGRDFDYLDSQDDRLAVIVDESLARQAWPGENPIGKRVKISVVPGQSDSPTAWAEVIGVAQHTRRYDLRREGRPQIYLPPWSRQLANAVLVVRSKADPAALTQAIRKETVELGAGRPVHTVRTMEEYVFDAMAGSRFALVLMGVLGGIAMVLSAVGLYGVVSYSVSQRTQEIGVRMALGARTGDILRMVLREGLGLTGVGIVVGLTAAFFLTEFVSSLLFGVEPTDPFTFVGVALVLAVVAAFSCYLPARRATRVDPIVALRYE